MTKFKIFLFSIFISALSIIEARELPNFSDLSEDASPAVVNITSTRTVSQRNSYGRGFGDPRYDEFACSVPRTCQNSLKSCQRDV